MLIEAGALHGKLINKITLLFLYDFQIYKIHFRQHLTSIYARRYFTTTNVAFDSKANVISRNLGLPARPKKPLSGFLRYLNEVRPVVSQSVKIPKQVPVVAAEQYKKLDEGQKQKYHQEFLNEKVFQQTES